ncbi:MAG: AmmeMemoRadiSam system radical SAM enzyme [Treponemataceae bacterium]
MVKPLFFYNDGAGLKKGGKIRCALCPHECLLAPGKSGLCLVRQNVDGKPALPFYGSISALNIDPIEKKPLFHFRPGSSVFSVGFVGCNLRCPFCQNWEISQTTETKTRHLEPLELISLAVNSKTGAIAYTYSEPLVHIEYVLESMRIAHKAGLANVLVTNGTARTEAANEVLSLCDAVNIDLKSSRAETYRVTLGGDIKVVKDFIAAAVNAGVHTEVTTLVVTDLNDTEEEIKECAEVLSELSADIPYHLSAYHPDYKYRAGATQAKQLVSFAAIARRSLHYVYVGNIAGESNGILCPVCAVTVIKRNGYAVDTSGFSRDSAGTASCKQCGAALPFRF